MPAIGGAGSSARGGGLLWARLRQPTAGTHLPLVAGMWAPRGGPATPAQPGSTGAGPWVTTSPAEATPGQPQGVGLAAHSCFFHFNSSRPSHLQ